MLEKSSRILIVDDERDSCANLSDIFTDLGYQVSVAFDGLSALDLFKQQSFDVALLDLKMPGMDGLELYRRIRRISSDTIAIVVSAYASSSTADSVLNAGAWKIVSKPVNFSQLLKLVEEALSLPVMLLVDDDHEFCDSLWELLRERGYRVCVANDALDATRKLEEKKFQLAIVDLKLPAGDGSQVLARLRETHPQVNSIVITGYRAEMEQSVQLALTGGANAVCYKPFDVQAFLATISKLCAPSPIN